MKKVMNLESELLATVAKCFPERKHNPQLQCSEYWWSYAKELHKLTDAQGKLTFHPDYYVPRVEIAVDIKPQAFLVQTLTGTPDNIEVHFSVVVMDADGNLRCTNIHTTDTGWPLAIGDEVAALLSSLGKDNETDCRQIQSCLPAYFIACQPRKN